jgi:hypothetical protein
LFKGEKEWLVRILSILFILYTKISLGMQNDLLFLSIHFIFKVPLQLLHKEIVYISIYKEINKLINTFIFMKREEGRERERESEKVRVTVRQRVRGEEYNELSSNINTKKKKEF